MNLLQESITNYINLKQEAFVTSHAFGYLIDRDDFIRNNQDINLSTVEAKIQKVLSSSGLQVEGRPLLSEIDILRFHAKEEHLKIEEAKEDMRKQMYKSYVRGDADVQDVFTALDHLYDRDVPHHDIAKMISVARNEKDFHEFFKYANLNSTNNNFETKMLYSLGVDVDFPDMIFMFGKENSDLLEKKLKSETDAGVYSAEKILKDVVLNADINIGNIYSFVSPENINYGKIQKNERLTNDILGITFDRFKERADRGKNLECITGFLSHPDIFNLVSGDNLDKIKEKMISYSSGLNCENEVRNFAKQISVLQAEKDSREFKEHDLMRENKELIRNIIEGRHYISLYSMTSDYYLFDYKTDMLFDEGSVSVKEAVALGNKLFKSTDTHEQKELAHKNLSLKIQIEVDAFEKSMKKLAQNTRNFINSNRDHMPVEEMELHKLINRLEEFNIESKDFNNMILTQMKSKEEFDFIVNGLGHQNRLNFTRNMMMHLISDGDAYRDRLKGGYLDQNLPKMFTPFILEVGDTVFNYCDSFQNGKGQLLIDCNKAYRVAKNNEKYPKHLNSAERKAVIYRLILEATQEDHKNGNKERIKDIFSIVKSMGLENSNGLNDYMVKGQLEEIHKGLEVAKIASKEFIDNFTTELLKNAPEQKENKKLRM